MSDTNDHPIKDDVEIETGPPGVSAALSFSIPVVAVVRDQADIEPVLRDWQGPGNDFAPIVARSIRNSFPHTEHGDVKVLCGGAVEPTKLSSAFTHLGLLHDRTDDVSQDESAIEAAKFIARHFDAKLVHEALGKHIRGGVER